MNLKPPKFLIALLRDETRHSIERYIISIAIIGFILHLGVILLIDVGILDLGILNDKISRDPIASIYTPFSFILLYEVYLLVYYLPKSITIYIGKQYEIVSLIIIRRIFKDLSNLDLSIDDWFGNEYNFQLTVDAFGIIVLFFLIWYFYKIGRRQNLNKKIDLDTTEDKLAKFIRAKRVMSALLIPTLFIMSLYSVTNWAWEVWDVYQGHNHALPDVNRVFYYEFFTMLVLVDVLLLMISFRHTEDYSKLIRNSGFIISTTLIKISFSADAILNTILVIAAVGFSVLILMVSLRYKEIGDGA
ncbi:MAG: hypothetical protein AAGI38_01855 [Bacteroidota bacterium]